MESQKSETLVYEETPIIKPIEEKRLPNPLDTPELSKHSRHGKHPVHVIGKIFFFIILFFVGVGGSTIIRPYLEGMSFPTFPSNGKNAIIPSGTPSPPIITADTTKGWNEYSIRAGTQLITYKLPKEVLKPVCDGAGCPSEGTYLSGKSRFTISSKFLTSPITNFAKLIVKDAGGKSFTTKETSIAGFTAVDFSGAFTGSTTGGYTFTTMHGVMIQIAPNVTVEINHFAPNGITTEFEKDDAVFSEILKTVTSVSSPSATVK